MRTTSRWVRRATALAAATGIAFGAGAGAAEAHGSHDRGGHGARHADRQAARGFTPVRTTAATVVGMTAPASGEVWTVERDGDGKAVLEHLAGGRWTTTRPGLDAGWNAQISGTASGDVWLVAGGQLRHWNGRRWDRVSTPAGLTAVAVTDVPGGDAYVGLDGAKSSKAGVYRVSGNGARWTSLGRPADEEYDALPTWTASEIDVTRGRVFVAWRKLAHSATNTVRAYSYGNGGWNDLVVQTFSGGGEREGAAAWLVPNPALVLALGAFDYGGTAGGLCRVWVAGSGASDCTTPRQVGGAALLADGRVVLGGNDFTPRWGGAVTQGTFAVRDEYGRESALVGDPGESTVAMAVEPGSDTAWAATTTGDVTSLQRWAH